MRPKYIVRLGIVLAVALCVVTAFSGAAAAQEVISINEDEDDALINVDGSGGAGDSGGDGVGSVDVGNDQGSAGGDAEVSASPDGVDVNVGGGGSAGEQEVGGGLDCSIAAAPQAPDCEPETPGGGDGGPNVDTNHDSDLNSEGGNGGGGVNVTSDQGNVSGLAEVAGSPDDGVEILAVGEGDVQGEGAEGGIDCDIPAGQPNDPSTVCEPVGGGGGVPSLPVNPEDPPTEPPIDPGGELPIDPTDPPIDPTDPPIEPPTGPGGELPIDQLQAA